MNPRPCQRCNETKPLRARSLCVACYSREHRAGRLANWTPSGPGGNTTGEPRAPLRSHGHYTLAIKDHCKCDPCAAYYRRYYDAANARTRAYRERRRAGSTAPAPRRTFTLGDPQLADEVVIDRVRQRVEVTVNDEHDRAGVAAVTVGTIGRNTAMQALRCSAAALDTAINELSGRQEAA